MGYSEKKPYQNTVYKSAVDPSFDRYLKSGAAVANKESVLEKPYKSKTYAKMQQDFNLPLPPPWVPPPNDWFPPPFTPGDYPPIVPVGGTGGLTCYWAGTGCEQLVGCWAGSDLVLDGPEAATAGYLPIDVTAGEIISSTISGAENRGIEILLDPTETRNTFTVSFKDANGVIASQTMDIVCATGINTLTFTGEDENDFGWAEYNQTAGFIDLLAVGFEIAGDRPMIGVNIDLTPDDKDYYPWMRVKNITVTQGSTIDAASLNLYYYGAQTGRIQTAEVYVYDADTYVAGSLIDNFPTGYYGTPVTWSPSNYGNAISDTTLVSIDVTALVQHIVNRPGFSGGNGMTFLIKPTAGTSNQWNVFYNLFTFYTSYLSITSAGVY